MKNLLIIIALVGLSGILSAQVVNSKTTYLKPEDYKAIAKKAQRASTIGTIVTTAGLVSVCYGIYRNSDNKYDGSAGDALIITGGILFNVGMPITIANGIKARKNYEAMKVGLTQNGLSLVYKF